MADKIVGRNQLASIVHEVRTQGKIIVTTNGSFDLLHVGHVNMLQEAKSLGDVLIVGMNSDTGVKRYKGSARPLCPQNHRARMLAALECTDYVTIFDELTPIPLLEIIQPDIHVNSPEHGLECVEREVVERHGGRIHLAQLIEGMSTSQLLSGICESMAHDSCRAIFVNPPDLLQAVSSSLMTVLHQCCNTGFQCFLLPTDDVAKLQPFLETCDQQGIEMHKLTAPLMALDQIDYLVAKYDLALARSVLISSDMKDIQIGREVNCKTILLRKTPQTSASSRSAYALGPNFTADNLQEALQMFTSSSASPHHTF
jgi:rfaE bifunctional protein nucleotidyltransferase chain/domain